MPKTWTDDKTWSGRPLYECEECPYSTINADDIVRHAVGHHGHRAASTSKHAGSLAGVDFASDEAAELANQLQPAGLAREHFDFPQSGTTGYTKPDVKRAARAAGLTPEED